MNCKHCNAKVFEKKYGEWGNGKSFEIVKDNLCCRCLNEMLHRLDDLMQQFGFESIDIKVCPQLDNPMHDVLHEQYEQKIKQAKIDHNVVVNAHKIAIRGIMGAIHNSDQACEDAVQQAKSESGMDYKPCDVEDDIRIDVRFSD